MMIELAATRHLGDFVKAKVILKRLLKREYNINKILTDSYYVGNPLFCSKGDHAFGRMYGYFPDLLKAFFKFTEQFDRLLGFVTKKSASSLSMQE